MNVDNPLADNPPTEYEDQSLVMRARSGDREALEDLVQRHQVIETSSPHKEPALRALRR
jgi:hypothetical protein